MVGSANVYTELVILHNGNNRISRAQSTLLDLARRNTLLNNVYYYYYYYYYYDNIRFPDSQKSCIISHCLSRTHSRLVKRRRIIVKRFSAREERHYCIGCKKCTERCQKWKVVNNVDKSLQHSNICCMELHGCVHTDERSTQTVLGVDETHHERCGVCMYLPQCRPVEEVCVHPNPSLKHDMHKGLFTLSISINTATNVTSDISLWLNCLDFLINQASHTKTGL